MGVVVKILVIKIALINEWNNCSADLIESSSLDVFNNSLAQCSRHPCL